MELTLWQKVFFTKDTKNNDNKLCESCLESIWFDIWIGILMNDANLFQSNCNLLASKFVNNKNGISNKLNIENITKLAAIVTCRLPQNNDNEKSLMPILAALWKQDQKSLLLFLKHLKVNMGPNRRVGIVNNIIDHICFKIVAKEKEFDAQIVRYLALVLDPCFVRYINDTKLKLFVQFVINVFHKWFGSNDLDIEWENFEYLLKCCQSLFVRFPIQFRTNLFKVCYDLSVHCKQSHAAIISFLCNIGWKSRELNEIRPILGKNSQNSNNTINLSQESTKLCVEIAQQLAYFGGMIRTLKEQNALKGFKDECYEEIKKLCEVCPMASK